MIRVLSILVSLGFAALSVSAQDGYRGIIPLITDRSEVERVLGRPDKNSPYELGEVRVSVFYRDPGCDKPATTCSCMVSADKVVLIVVKPHISITIADLNLDLKDWKIAEVKDHLPGLLTYSNPKSGITYRVNDGIVTSIQYAPTAENCKKVKERKT